MQMTPEQETFWNALKRDLARDPDLLDLTIYGPETLPSGPLLWFHIKNVPGTLAIEADGTFTLELGDEEGDPIGLYDSGIDARSRDTEAIADAMRVGIARAKDDTLSDPEILAAYAALDAVIHTPMGD